MDRRDDNILTPDAFNAALLHRDYNTAIDHDVALRARLAEVEQERDEFHRLLLCTRASDAVAERDRLRIGISALADAAAARAHIVSTGDDEATRLRALLGGES